MDWGRNPLLFLMTYSIELPATYEFHARGRTIAHYKPDKGYYWYYADHLGSTRIVDGPDIGTDMRRDYYPFGEVFTVYGDEHSNYTFTGVEKDKTTGLHYFGARYYDSSIGRFLTPDPLGDTAPHLTPYQYCSNNPLNRIDLTGMQDKNNDDEENQRRQNESNGFGSFFSNLLGGIFQGIGEAFSKKPAEAENAQNNKGVQQEGSTPENLPGLAQQYGNHIGYGISNLAANTEFYMNVSVGKQTMGTTGFGGVTLTSSNGVALTGGVDGTIGIGIPVSLSMGFIGRTDGNRASVSDISKLGVGTTMGFGLGGEFSASPNGSVYNVGVVFAPAVWAGGNAWYTFILKK